MTREESIALLNEQYETCKRIYDCSADQRKSYPNVPQFMEALGMALSALRPVSRERVERMTEPCEFCGEWIGGDCTPKEQDAGYKIYAGYIKQVAVDDFWEDEIENLNFCPVCGRPMTDEAVEMVMKRLEALKDES